MDEKCCQSCAMPMGETDELYGTNADGTKSKDYCQYCYMGGRFLADISMDEMIMFCVPHLISVNLDMSDEEAREHLDKVFPTLKRWQND